MAYRAKIGPDGNENPVCCRNVMSTVDTNGALSVGYNEIAD
jgi:hypothetical protein